RLHDRYKADALVLSGGCAMNSVAAGKIAERSPFTRVYVPPAPGDAGGAIGAALWVWAGAGGGGRPEPMTQAALGPAYPGEAVGEWFEGEDDDVPFMSKVLGVRSKKRALIPAVVHVDGTGRLQTVERAANPRYYDLIRAFGRRTGVPMVLNTSFNENEPIVN